MKSVFDNLINGNLKDAKHGAQKFSGAQLARYAMNIGWTKRKAHAAAYYLKNPSQQSYDQYCQA